MSDDQSELQALRDENQYLKALVEKTTAQLLVNDRQAIAIRQELEQKRRGFRLMSELTISLGRDLNYVDLFFSVCRRVNATLNMQRTLVLVAAGEEKYRALVLHGYPATERDSVEALLLEIPSEMLDPYQPLVVTAADPDTYLGELRQRLHLPYFISAPVVLHGQITSILVTGRLVEGPPYMPRLGKSDAETVQTVSAYLAAILAGHRLRMAENLAKRDPLTELPNLRGISEHLHNILALARRGGFYVATMFMDLDGFKAVNDTFGHPAGDLVLRTVAKGLSESIRETDVVGRIGGDEFIVILSHVKQPEEAAKVARKMIRKISSPVKIDGKECRVGASIGISVYPMPGGAESELIHAADAAMSALKNRGKNPFAFAEDRR